VDNRGIEYLRAVLAAEPSAEAERILSLRAAWLSGLAPAAGGSPAWDEVRIRTSSDLEALRREFWAVDESELRRRLDAFDDRRFPELSVSLARLRTVAAYRQVLLDLSERAGAATGFAQSLRQVVVAPSREAAVLRDARLAALREDRAQSQGPRIFAVRGLVRQIANQHPDLFALEDEWLTGVLAICDPRPGWLLRQWRSGIVQFLITVLLALLLINWVFRS
jgi:hypothetical protein